MGGEKGLGDLLFGQVDGRREVLDGLGGIAQILEFRQGGRRPGAASDERILHPCEGPLQIGVGHGDGCVFSKIAAVGGFGHSSLPSPIAGLSVMPARTSATRRTATSDPRRRNLPAMLSRQPRSPASTRLAPLASMSPALSLTRGSE